jgi:hypothetical protein
VVGADSEIQISAGLIEQKCHPDRDKSCCLPGVVVVAVRQVQVDDTLAVKLSQPLSSKI